MAATTGHVPRQIFEAVEGANDDPTVAAPSGSITKPPISISQAVAANGSGGSVSRAAATEPKAHCICWAFDAPAIKYVVRYRLMELREDEWVDSNVRIHIFAALGRARMEIPISRSDLYLHSARHLATTKNLQEQRSRLEMLGSLALFATLTEKEREALAAWLKPVPFAPGEAVIRQGEVAESLFVLARGTLDVYNEPQGEMRKKEKEFIAPLVLRPRGRSARVAFFRAGDSSNEDGF